MRDLIRLEVTGGRAVLIEHLAEMRRRDQTAWEVYLLESVRAMSPTEAEVLVKRARGGFAERVAFKSKRRGAYNAGDNERE